MVHGKSFHGTELPVTGSTHSIGNAQQWVFLMYLHRTSLQPSVFQCFFSFQHNLRSHRAHFKTTASQYCLSSYVGEITSLFKDLENSPYLILLLEYAFKKDERCQIKCAFKLSSYVVESSKTLWILFQRCCFPLTFHIFCSSNTQKRLPAFCSCLNRNMDDRSMLTNQGLLNISVLLVISCLVPVLVF